MKKQIKVTVIGDSISKGVIYENEQLSIAENPAINIIGENLNYEIENVSSYGQTLKRIFKKKIIENVIEKRDKKKRNFAVLSIGGNDSDYDWKEVSLSPNENHLPKTPLNEFVSDYEKIIKQLQKNGFEIIVCSITPIKAEWYFNNVICKIANEKNVLEFLHNDLSNLTRHQELFNNEIIKIAMREKVKFVDIRQFFLAENDCFNYYCKDGAHLTREGQKYIAGKVTKLFLSTEK